MREILYRLWHKRWKELIYLTGLRYINDKSMQIYYKDEDGDLTTTSVNLSDVVIEQYSGKKDDDGVKIWEGDTVSFEAIEWTGQDGEMVPYRGVVEYSEEHASFSFKIQNGMLAIPHETSEIKVIGRIAKQDAELEKEKRINPLIEYSTSQLKSELRRRYLEGNKGRTKK